MSGLSRSWCSSACISLFAISCGPGADLALNAALRLRNTAATLLEQIKTVPERARSD
jgi:hypothetical protein